MIRVATLTVRPGMAEAFRAYEHAAARIMAKHGGAIERVIVERPQSGVVADHPLREVHIVTFPSDEAFAAYRADPELVALAAQRDACIADTQILVGSDGPRYGN
jgi:uncharacterized protein (DUF1330 family)